MKYCPKCKQYLSTDNFNASNNRKDGLSCYCKSCEASKWQDYNRTSQGAMKKHEGSWRKKGIGPDFTYIDYLIMAREQNFRCKICKKAFEDMQNTPHVDHNHATGKVRGILCASCNLLIGKAQQIGIDKLEEYVETN